MTPHPEFIAFYGSLRADCGGVLESQLRAGLKFRGYCEINGDLLLIKSAPEESYPGLVKGSGIVKAELYELPEEMDFAMLDEHEGSEFHRSPIRLWQPNVDCWIYLYLGSSENKPTIVSGDWGKVGNSHAT